MLKALTLGGALAALLVSAAYAHEPHHAKVSPDELVYSAIVEVGGGYLFTSDLEGEPKESKEDFNDEEFGVIGGAARASIPLAANVSAQFDIDGLLAINERSDEDDEDYLQNFGFLSGHVTWRDPSRFAAGALVSYGEANGGDDEEAQIWFAGAEAQAYFGNLTLYGQAGYMEADDESEDDVFTEAFWLRAVGRYFPDPNSRLQAEFVYMDGEENAGAGDGEAEDKQAYGWGVRYDRAINNGPVSLFVSYRGSRHENKEPPDEGDDDALTDHTIMVGFTLRLGAQNMLAEDRRGATLDTPAWLIGRATGWSLQTVD